MDSSAKKPASDRKTKRRDAIVSVAMRNFYQHGYAGTSMSAISAELGGSKGTLWNYFPSKEALFTACIDEATRAFREALLIILHPSQDPRVAIEQFCTRFMEKILRPESCSLFQLVVGESVRQPEVGRIFYERGPGTTRRLLQTYFDEQIALGRLRPAPGDQMARLAVSLCQGEAIASVLHQISQPSPEQIAARAREFSDLFMQLYGIETPPQV